MLCPSKLWTLNFSVILIKFAQIFCLLNLGFYYSRFKYLVSRTMVGVLNFSNPHTGDPDFETNMIKVK